MIKNGVGHILYLLFDKFSWLFCFCVVYIEKKYFINPLYFTLLISIQGFLGEKLRKCHGIFTKIVMENLGITRFYLSTLSFDKSMRKNRRSCVIT